MWLKISDTTKIKMGDKILRHPSDGENAKERPTGQEPNSELYEVTSILLYEGVTLKRLVSVTIGSMKIEIMARYVNFTDLKNGEWWCEGGC